MVAVPMGIIPTELSTRGSRLNGVPLRYDIRTH